MSLGLRLCVLSALLHLQLFSAAAWEGASIGGPALTGSIQTNATGALVLTGAGAELGLRNDQAYFAFERREGDFDLVVRVESLTAPDLFGRAGLMARDSLEGNAPFTGVFATPNVAGILAQVRDGAGGSGRQVGPAFANYPFAWLRLKRVGNVWTSAASGDGKTWTRLDSSSLSLGNPAYVGLAVTSWRTNDVATAVFRDWQEGSGDITPSTTPVLELPGPSSRRTGLVISEIMYHPPARTDGKDLEFVELFNSQSIFQEIGGYRLSGALDYTFPEGTVLPAGGFVVVAHTPADVREVYGLTNVLGGYPKRLSNGAGVVQLRSRIGAVLLEAHYDSQPPWPAAADGAGHSLVLLRPSFGERNPRAWGASRWKGGSPGAWDGYAPDAFSDIKINELRASSVPPATDFVELFNPNSGPVDLSGAWLSDSPTTNKFHIPDGTVIPSRGFLSFDAHTLGFGLKAEGDTVFLTAPDQSRVIDAVRFDVQSSGLSSGRTPDGAPGWRTLVQATPGAVNASAPEEDVVISEIMFHPISNDPLDQYLELHNRGANPADLSGWALTSGVSYTFPAGSVLPPGGDLVVARSAERLRSHYAQLTLANCLGDFQGKLSGGGERLVLARPEVAAAAAGNGVPKTNWVTVTEVTYGDGGRWGRWSDGGGSSLELIDVRSDPSLAANWADSDETAKGEWTTIEHTGVLDLGVSNYGFNQVQILLEGEGECLVDNVQVIGPGGTNMVSNGDFEAGLANWAVQGSHRSSSVEAGQGVGGSQCLHVRAESSGDTGANRIRGLVVNGLKEGQTVTIRAQARWLRGCPELLVRLRGNYLEAFGRLETSSRLGTPGLPNSRRIANAPPAIWEVSHAPALPAADQPVVITARVNDPDGLGQVLLRYRLDPAPEIAEVAMHDDGQNGDQFAGDGLFSAIIPGQPTGTMIAFHVQAKDANADPAVGTFPSNAPARECLIRVGEVQPGGSFGTYRIWMTQAVRNTWSTREKLSNAPLDVTFVYGGQRIIYNASARYAGSPFVSTGYSGPTGALCGYVVNFPSDDPFLGITDLKLDWPVRDGSLQMEQMAYWLADQLGIPSNHRRFVNLFVNGYRRGKLYEDAQQPNSDMVAQYFPDDTGGELFKIDDWFEFENAAVNFVNTDATLDDFTTSGGQKKTARYRWNWRKHAVKDSANDYRNLFALVDATQMTDYSAFPRNVESVMDVPEVLGVIALEHMVGNWDSFGFYRGKNMFTYKPAKGRWNLLTWDIDFVLSAEGYAPNFDVYSTIDPTISQIVWTPCFRRAYWRILDQAAQGPLRSARCDPMFNANYSALLANGITASSPSAGSRYMSDRIKYLQGELAQANVPFALETTNTQTSTPINIFWLRGTAPVRVQDIQINGRVSPVTWVQNTEWEAQLTLEARTNQLVIVGLDERGQPVPDAPLHFEIDYSGTPESPVGQLVFSEVMHHPTIPGAEYVELFNNSYSSTYDVSGWRIQGLDFTFPPGTYFQPRGYLVVAKNRSAYTVAYGKSTPLCGEFAGTLSLEGETLQLVQPGLTPAQDRVVAELTYEASLPWPAAANAGGYALQIRDPSQSQNRVANWTVDVPVPAPEWELVSVTGAATSSNLLVYVSSLPPVRDLASVEGVWDAMLGGSTIASFQVGFQPGTTNADWTGDFIYDNMGQEQHFQLPYVVVTNNTLVFGLSPNSSDFTLTMAADGQSMTGTYQVSGQSPMRTVLRRYNPGGEVYLDDLRLNSGSAPDPATNLIRNGDFEASLGGSWTVSPNCATSSTSTNAHHSGQSALHLVAKSGGSAETNALWQTLDGVEIGKTYTLSYWLKRSTNAPGLVVRLGDWSVASTQDLHPLTTMPVEFTPGRPNSTQQELPAMPLLWLNELQPINTTGPADSSGHRGPWVELANSGTNSVSLTNYYLATAATNLTRWAFPTNAVVAAGQFVLVWLDGATQETTAREWHTSFQLAAESGMLILSRQVGSEAQILDYLSYTNVPANASIGWGAQPGESTRQTYATATPNGSNSGAAPLPRVVINEWLAANRSTWVDPDNGKDEDWFELFNTGFSAADLSGYWLSDSIVQPLKSQIPNGTILPARSYLVVWADGKSGPSASGSALHANFKLDADGEVIRLSAPDGTVVDQVSFGVQSADQAQGRWPDGENTIEVLARATPGAPNAAPSELRVAGVQKSGGTSITLRWSSLPGQQFQLQYKTVLDATSWLTLPDAVTAQGPETEVTLPISDTDGQRFYRVVLLGP